MADKSEKPKDGKKALSWKERNDTDVAGRRWDDDVRDGMGKWNKGK